MVVLNGSSYGSSLSVNSASSKSSAENDEASSGNATSCLSPSVPSRLTANHRSHSTNTLLMPGSLSNNHRSSSSSDLYTSSHLTNSKSQHHHSSLMSISDTVGFDFKSTAEDKTEMGVMDLYILQSVSDFYHQFCVAWDNWNIVSCLNTRQSFYLSTDHLQQHLGGAMETVPLKSPMLQRFESILVNVCTSITFCHTIQGSFQSQVHFTKTRALTLSKFGGRGWTRSGVVHCSSEIQCHQASVLGGELVAIYSGYVCILCLTPRTVSCMITVWANLEHI